MYVVLAVIAIGLGVALYLIFAPGPRRWRAFHRARNSWKTAPGRRPSPLPSRSVLAGFRPPGRRACGTWLGSAASAVDQSLKERKFEDAQEHAAEAAALLGLDEAEQRGRVVESMLGEVRRLFAEGTSESAHARGAGDDRPHRPPGGERPPRACSGKRCAKSV